MKAQFHSQTMLVKYLENLIILWHMRSCVCVIGFICLLYSSVKFIQYFLTFFCICVCLDVFFVCLNNNFTEYSYLFKKKIKYYLYMHLLKCIWHNHVWKTLNKKWWALWHNFCHLCDTFHKTCHITPHNVPCFWHWSSVRPENYKWQQSWIFHGTSSLKRNHGCRNCHCVPIGNM